MIKKYAIFGNGGFAKEVESLIFSINKIDKVDIKFIDKNNTNESDVISEEHYDPIIHGDPIIAIGNPILRKKISIELKEKFKNINFPNIIHQSVFIGKNVEIGVGNIITQNCVLTTNIKLKDFIHLNLSTTIGHDVVLGNYFTTAPGVHISGNVTVDDLVYFGTNSCTKEKISICSNVIVGAGAVVVENITENGTYVGLPAKLKKEIHNV